MNNYNEFNSQNNNYTNIDNSVNNNLGPINGDNYNNVDPNKSNNSKKGCIITCLIFLFFAIAGGGAILYFSNDGVKAERSYKEYNQLQNINDYLGLEALSSTTTFFDDDELYHDTPNKYVVLEVRNDSDYYVNNLPVCYYEDGHLESKSISMRPHSKAVIDYFIIDEKDADRYENLELKNKYLDDEDTYLSMNHQKDVIYADEIKLDFIKTDDNAISFTVTNNSKYDFEFNESQIMAFSYNYMVSRNGIPVKGPGLKAVGPNDDSYNFNVPKESSREFIYETSNEDFMYRTSSSYQIIFVFPGESILDEQNK